MDFVILNERTIPIQAPSWRDRMAGMVGPSRSVQTKCLKPKVTVSILLPQGYSVSERVLGGRPCTTCSAVPHSALVGVNFGGSDKWKKEG